MRKLLIVLGAAGLFLTNIACHPAVQVSMTDNEYDPETVTAGGVPFDLGVNWTNNGENTHTATSTGNGLFFDSGSVAPSGSFFHIFAVAGTYPYHCDFHKRMRGTVALSTFASPTEGTTADSYDVQWAFGDNDDPTPPTIPDGFNADVQIKRPGKTFKIWKANQTGSEVSAEFDPHRAGTYKFRARLQHTATGKKTGYSPPATIVVNAP